MAVAAGTLFQKAWGRKASLSTVMSQGDVGEMREEAVWCLGKPSQGRTGAGAGGRSVLGEDESSQRDSREAQAGKVGDEEGGVPRPGRLCREFDSCSKAGAQNHILSLYCVASTVCDVNSPYVQPVGWCQENGRTLIAPQGYPNPENFSWTEYLEATQTNAVPAKVFKMRLPHGFLPNMKLEVVDKRNPRLIRVATIVDVDDQRVKVHFDGWDHKYDYWVEADSPDIHPIGWCDVTGHPLEVPQRTNDLKILPGQAVCPTPGCRGIGHIRGPRYSGHHSAFGCPYSDMNLKKEATLHDRLREQTQANLESDSSHSKSKNLCSLNFNGKHEKVNSQPRLVQQAKCLKIKGKEDIDLDNLFR
ncbi:hypothetical protein H8959_001863, partial [Pygathrix nigripes]